MSLQCRQAADEIKPPTITIRQEVLSIPPFTLNGAPLSAMPTLANLTTKRRKPGATNDQSNADTFLASDNFFNIPERTFHILAGNPDCTLRYENTNFSLDFICLHKQIWSNLAENFTNTPLQLSMYFSTPRDEAFHIVIPIEFRNSSQDENLFLKQWLYRNPGPIKSGLTHNELLNFRGSDTAEFRTIPYCLTLNRAVPDFRKNIPYILCYFNTPLYINRNLCQNWLQTWIANPTPIENIETENPIFRKSFSSIYNFLKFGLVIQNKVAGRMNLIVSTEQHFADTQKDLNVRTTSYTVSVRSIAGSAYRKPATVGEGQVQLQNVKCFPIDIFSQVDEHGNIVIDQNTQKPVEIVDALPPPQTGPTDAETKAAEDRQKTINRLMLVIFIMIGLTVTAIIAIVLSVFVFSAKSGSSVGQALPEPVAPGLSFDVVANVAAAAAAAGPPPPPAPSGWANLSFGTALGILLAVGILSMGIWGIVSLVKDTTDKDSKK